MKDQVAALSFKGLAVGCVTQESLDKEKAEVQNGHYQPFEYLCGICRQSNMSANVSLKF